MSIYTKPVSQITVTDLKELLEKGDVENLRLEFKSEVSDRDDTLKKLSSFANTYGGTIVVGAKAPSADGPADVRTELGRLSGHACETGEAASTGIQLRLLAHDRTTEAVIEPIE
jgi:Schlafen, AlbA_2